MGDISDRLTDADIEAQTMDWPVALTINPKGKSPVLLVCEHASAFIPPELYDLGLKETDLTCPAVWDPGAALVARRLSALLDAPLVEATQSRLVYDCNRPPESCEAIRSKVERYRIPGNAHLEPTEYERRVRNVHDVFHADLNCLWRAHHRRHGHHAKLISIHSFMPVFNGKVREVEIGFLHGKNARLALTALGFARADDRFNCQLNAPYSAEDGVLYLLDRHAGPQNAPALMIEVGNNLINSPKAAACIGDYLSTIISRLNSAKPPKPNEKHESN